MRSDGRDDDIFDALVRELEAEDPAFVARTVSTERAEGPVRIARMVVLLIAGLVALPAALETGLYPIGVLGFAAAVFALIRLLRPGAVPGDAARGAWLVPHLERSTHEDGRGGSATRHVLPVRWQLVVGSTAVVLLVGQVLSAS